MTAYTLKWSCHAPAFRIPHTIFMLSKKKHDFSLALTPAEPSVYEMQFEVKPNTHSNDSNNLQYIQFSDISLICKCMQVVSKAMMILAIFGQYYY